MQYQPESITISERGRQLGWQADKQLLRDLSNEGWEPHRFRITTFGLTIDFKFVGESSQRYEYSCSQEGGNADSLVRDFNKIFAPKGWEVIFAYRVGSKGAENTGAYTRFLLRREIGQKKLQKFGYHYVYRKPSASNTSKSKSWKKICRIPSHEGWGMHTPMTCIKKRKTSEITLLANHTNSLDTNGMNINTADLHVITTVDADGSHQEEGRPIQLN